MLRLTTEAGGRDREGTLPRIEAMRRIADEQGRGIMVSQDYAAQIGWDEQEWQSTVSDGSSFQYTQDARRGGVVAVEVLRCSGGLRGYADGGVVGCDAVTISVRSAFTPAGPITSAINAPQSP